MNRIIRSSLSVIAVVLLIPVVFLGCSTCEDGCSLLSLPCYLGGPLFLICWAACMNVCVGQQTFSDCTESPDECTTTFEELQIAAIQFCEEYPEECQEAFDTWVDAEE